LKNNVSDFLPRQQAKQIQFILMNRLQKKNGHPSLLAPPTFLTVVGHEQDEPYKYITDLGIDFGKILHAGQTYKYHYPIYAGNVIKMESQIIDLYEKKKGTLQFIEFQSTYTNQDNIMVAESLATLVAR
jgi:hypothetical protein